MTFDTLLKLLEPYNPAFFKRQHDCEISSVRYLGSPQGDGKVTELYVGHTDDFLYFGVPARAVNLLCFGDTAVVEENPAFSEKNCIVIPASENEPVIFNGILDAIEIDDKYMRASELLFQSTMLLRRDSFDFNQMTDVIYELLGNPFAICNFEGVLIGYKNIFDIHTGYSYMFKKGDYKPIPSGFIESNKTVDASSEPVVFDKLMDVKVKNVKFKVEIASSIVAYFCLVENERPITESDILMVKIICDWLSREFRKSSIYLTPQSGESSRLLADLLENKPYPDDGILRRAEELKFGQKKWHYVLVVNFDKTNLNHTTIQNLRSVFEYKIPECKSLLFQESIVLYVNVNDGDFFRDDTKKTIEEIAGEYNLTIGISSRYSNLGYTHTSYDQGVFALSFGKRITPSNRVYEYDDVALYHLLNYKSNGDEIKRFCHPKLIELMEYDNEHGTAYLYTTYVLLLSSGKQVDAAKKLHIHRSTMLYRMEKIAEITGGLDLYDTYTVTRLYLSFAILVYTGSLNAQEYNLVG